MKTSSFILSALFLGSMLSAEPLTDAQISSLRDDLLQGGRQLREDAASTAEKIISRARDHSKTPWKTCKDIYFFLLELNKTTDKNKREEMEREYTEKLKQLAVSKGCLKSIAQSPESSQTPSTPSSN